MLGYRAQIHRQTLMAANKLHVADISYIYIYTHIHTNTLTNYA